MSQQNPTVAGDAIVRLRRCAVMGVLNVTPDSFSDGGRYSTTQLAVAHGLAMWADGADYVDVGGESTRPGAGRVDPQEELGRVLPVVAALTESGVPVSIDTTRAEVADAALRAGAVLVNDVSGGLADPAMAAVVAASGAPWVITHSRGTSRAMYAAAHYDDVVGDVIDELRLRIDDAVRSGVDPSRLILDPGLGFAKQVEHNWSILARLDEVVALGFPVLVGASRKRFLAGALAGRETRSDAVQRDAATIATTVLAAQAGAWGVRVHDVGGSADAVGVVGAVGRATRRRSPTLVGSD